MDKIIAKNWFFCLECDSVSYKFDCCGNTVCNGSGCEKCDELHSEILRIMNAGESPSKDELVNI